jgi:hypothetical protein
MTEVVLGAIANARFKTGTFSAEKWVLVVTDQRLLGARLTDEVARRISDEVRTQAGAAGAGFFGQLGARIRAASAIGQRYAAMTPEGILAETPGNWALRPGQVSSIKVERKSRPGGEDGPDLDFLKITIETPGGHGAYDTEDDNPGQRDVQALFARTFGPVVR